MACLMMNFSDSYYGGGRSKMSLSIVEDHREDLEALAERDDLRVSRYAELLLEAETTEGA